VGSEGLSTLKTVFGEEDDDDDDDGEGAQLDGSEGLIEA